MIDIDSFLDRTRSPHYKCFDFVREVWLAWFGEDIGAKLSAFLCAVSQRHFVLSDIKQCRRLDAPIDPCFVLLQPYLRALNPHVGIWHQGSILHLGLTGVEFMPLKVVARGYRKVSFFL